MRRNLVPCSCGCGQKIKDRDPRGRPRKYAYRHQHRKQGNQLFWSKVDTTGECWNWTGARDKAGYGMLTVSSVARNSLRSHRYAWQYIYGKTLPVGMSVLHKCDNPSCVRLEHLWLGTRADNNRDRAAKLRSASGEQSPVARLNFEQVSEIRRHVSYGILSKRQIALRYGVVHDCISDIAAGRTWNAWN